MRFCTEKHPYYAGVDLHARSLYACVLDQEGEAVLHRKARTTREETLALLALFRDEGVVVACECLFCWYWLAALCADEGIPFVLGHALYVKVVHGGKTKIGRHEGPNRRAGRWPSHRHCLVAAEPEILVCRRRSPR